MPDPVYGKEDWQSGASNPDIVTNQWWARLVSGGGTVLTLRDFQNNTPPVSPSDGEWYFTGPAATGDWDGFNSQLAFYNDGWDFHSLPDGLVIVDASEGKRLMISDGGSLPGVNRARFLASTEFPAFKQSRQGAQLNQAQFTQALAAGPGTTNVTWASIGVTPVFDDILDIVGFFYDGTDLAFRAPGNGIQLKAVAAGVDIITDATIPAGDIDVYIEGVFV